MLLEFNVLQHDILYMERHMRVLSLHYSWAGVFMILFKITFVGTIHHHNRTILPNHAKPSQSLESHIQPSTPRESGANSAGI